MKLGNGLVQVAVVGGEERLYSSKLACPECGINVPVLEPRSFSFNSVYGACPECNGLGSKYDFDPAKVINDWSKPLLDGGLGPGSASQNLIRILQLAAPSLRLRSLDALRAASAQDAEPDSVRSRCAARRSAADFSASLLICGRRWRRARRKLIASGCWTTCRPQRVLPVTASGFVRRAWP